MSSLSHSAGPRTPDDSLNLKELHKNRPSLWLRSNFLSDLLEPLKFTCHFKLHTTFHRKENKWWIQLRHLAAEYRHILHLLKIKVCRRKTRLKNWNLKLHQSLKPSRMFETFLENGTRIPKKAIIELYGRSDPCFGEWGGGRTVVIQDVSRQSAQ